VAWIGAIVLFALALLAFDVVREWIVTRRARQRAARGLRPVVWSTRRRWATFAAGLGCLGLLVGALLLLRAGSNSSSKTESLNVIPSTTTSTATPNTTSPDPGRAPQQVRVAVINASGVAHAAQQKADALKPLGYQIVGLGNEALRPGTAVQCRPGFEKEAVTLARNVGGGASVEPFPNPPPVGSANADCIVVVGK
jgi:hypothetical protein